MIVAVGEWKPTMVRGIWRRALVCGINDDLCDLVDYEDEEMNGV